MVPTPELLVGEGIAVGGLGIPDDDLLGEGVSLDHSHPEGELEGSLQLLQGSVGDDGPASLGIGEAGENDFGKP